MPAGISTAKARRNSKTKASASRAKIGLPAKAGKRRPHNIKHDAFGNYVAADFSPRVKEQKAEEKGFVMPESKVTTIIKPSGVALYDGLACINKMEQTSKINSDPFAFQRMRTHFKHGLFDLNHK